MKLQHHVLYAIDDFFNNKKDAALMHACFAIDGTAKKLFPNQISGKKNYKECLRNYWWLIEPFIGSGLNLEETRWTHLTLEDGHGKIITDPDLADIIYHIFRCNNAHGEAVPLEYDLLPVSDGFSRWIVGLEDKRLHMPERVIWALLAVAVFSKVNLGTKTEGGHFLSWGSETLDIGIKNFIIKDSWGKEDEIREFLFKHEHIRVKMNF